MINNNRKRKENLNNTKNYGSIFEEIKNWPEYLEERFKAVRLIYNLEFSKLLDFLNKNKNLAQPELLFVIDYVLQNLKDEGKQIPVLDDKIFDLLTENLDFEILEFNNSQPSKTTADFYIDLCYVSHDLGKDDFVLKIVERLSQYSDPEVQAETVKIFFMVNKQDLSFNLIKKILDNKSELRFMKTKMWLIPFLTNFKNEKSVDLLKTIIDDNDELYILRWLAIKALAEIGNEEAKKKIISLLDIDDFMIKIEAIKNLGYLGRENLNKVKEFLNEQNKDIRQAAILSLKNFGFEGFAILKKLVNSNEAEDTIVAIQALSQIDDLTLKTEALDILKGFLSNLSDKQIDIVVTIINSLSNFYLEGEQFLKELLAKIEGEKINKIGNNERQIIIQTIKESLYKIQLKKYDKKTFIRNIIFRQEPVLVNPAFGQEQQRIISELNDIVFKLREKNDNLIGLIILGSFSKGYYFPLKSDIDWALIFKGEKDQELIDSFKNEAFQKNISLCLDRSISLGEAKSMDVERLSILFNGIFIGNRNELRQAQKKIIIMLREEKEERKQIWESIRNWWIIHNLENYIRGIERFNFSSKEIAWIRQIRKYLWQLPDYHTIEKFFLSSEKEKQNN